VNGEILRILNRAELRERLILSGAEPGGGTPEEFGAFIKTEITKWSSVMKTAGLGGKL
jgi:tripartite-type tricarboxylate transporter receptor subunit TctC